MDFLNYDLNFMRKKIMMGFLQFAELYVKDIKRRSKQVMERFRKKVSSTINLYYYIT